MSTPRKLSVVKVCDEAKEWLNNHGKSDSPLLGEERFVFLGETPNMQDHCVVLSITHGTAIVGYHVDNFIEVPDEES